MKLAPTWEVTAIDDATGTPERLLAKDALIVNGLGLHLEAWRVTRDGDEPNGTQRHPYNDEDMQRLWRVFSNGDGDFNSITIPGFPGEWIVLATPIVG